MQGNAGLWCIPSCISGKIRQKRSKMHRYSYCVWKTVCILLLEASKLGSVKRMDLKLQDDFSFWH